MLFDRNDGMWKWLWKEGAISTIQGLIEGFIQPSNEFCINRYRDSKQNLRTTFIKIIRKAGLEPWPKLFHNLRSSCQTDLANRYPAHVVCQWLGNSEAVAKEHYLQVTESHFEQATCPIEKRGQNLGQQASEMSGNSVCRVEGVNVKTPEIMGKSLDSRGFNEQAYCPTRIRT